MLRYLGYVAIALSTDFTTNRTCRLRNATPERLRELIALNLDGLARVLEFNRQNDLFLYRVSSQIIPFGSHAVNEVRWWEECAEELAATGAMIRDAGARVSMHPGQFTVLNSPNSAVIEAAIADIEWHVRLLEALGTDTGCKVIIHIGGAYGNKPEATDRFCATVAELPERYTNRLVIENDERVYTAEEVLAISAHTGLPMIFDWLHHRVNPGSDPDPTDLMNQVFDTWRDQDGIPKMHFSSQLSDGRPGQHDDWINAKDFARFLRLTPDRPFDCMLEAKRKDQALFRLREDLSAMSISENGHIPARDLS